MAILESYRRKRNFDVTGEPRGKSAKSDGHAFVVQKHAARRLHYDFRLELDGVLKSWAIAKGPSLVPGEKRLAVHVEDHPLDYASFEGTIPAGQYGAGTVMVWDRGTWTSKGDPHEGLEKGRLDFTLDGEKLKGGWHLVRMRGKAGDKRDNWLLIKSDDDAARGPDDPDVLEEEPRSVLTHRSNEEIAGDETSRQWNSGRPARPATAGGRKTPRERAAEPIAMAVKPAPARKAQSAKPVRKLDLKMPKGAHKAKLPGFIAPELATLAARPPEGASWLYEVKLDGYRIEARLEKGHAVLLTRNGLDWTNRFPALATAVGGLLVASAILDGEIVAEDADGISDFSRLQDLLKNGQADRLVCYFFDLLYLDGHDLTDVPLIDRKTLLAAILEASPSPALRYSEHFDAHGERLLQHICRLGAEGMVSKRRDAPYSSGRSRDWIKSKCANRQEFVIAGFVPSTTSGKAVGSLVLGYYGGGELVYAGRAGTGFSSRMTTDLYADLERDRLPESPFKSPLPAEARRNVVWVKPTRVAEIEFRGWTGGNVLRQAAFKGLREDKEAPEIVREETVAAPAASQSQPADSNVRLTHPDRVLWPEAGITKQGLMDYYTAVWPFMERHVTGRPLALLRCPAGIAHGCFFQKHAWKGMDTHVKPIDDPQEDEKIVGIESLDGLIALVQASVLEIHPWGARADDLDHPDRLIFDLDPGPGVVFADLVAAARVVRDRLAAEELESFVKTTGRRGLHVVAPIVPAADWDAAKSFSRRVAEAMAQDDPDHFTATVTKSQRNRRVYVDYLRNARGATAVCTYSTRARSKAGVATPLNWNELDDVPCGDHFTLANLGKRLAHLEADPWPDFFALRQHLPAAAKSPGKGRAGAR
jgi:bifunctional non-homologous end joining protein LigD